MVIVLRFRSLLIKLDFDEVTSWILVTNACVHIYYWPIDERYSTNGLRSYDEYLEIKL